jgi:hypothetical protein
MADLPMSRSAALVQGITQYFTGKPCKRGHIANRHASSGTCSVCAAAALRERYAKNPEYYKARVTEWYQNNREHAQETSRIYRKKNPEIRKAAIRRWREANPERVKEINRRGSLAYAARYPERVRANKQRWSDDPENKKARRETILAWHKANPVIFAQMQGRLL